MGQVVGVGGKLEASCMLCYDNLDYIAMILRSASIGPNMHRQPIEMSHNHWCQFQMNAFNVVPSMGPIVSVMNLHHQQTHSRKEDPVS